MNIPQFNGRFLRLIYACRASRQHESELTQMTGFQRQYFFELGADAFKMITVCEDERVCHFESVEYDDLGMMHDARVYDVLFEDISEVVAREAGVEIVTRDGKRLRV